MALDSHPCPDFPFFVRVEVGAEALIPEIWGAA